MQNEFLLDQLCKEISEGTREQVLSEEKQKAADGVNQEVYMVFFLAFGLALNDKFPRWGAKAMSRLMQSIMDWINIYIIDWDRNLERMQNEFAIRYGESLEIEVKDSDVWW